MLLKKGDIFEDEHILDFVCITTNSILNKNGELVPAVFKDVKVIIRTMPDGTPARGENAEKLAMQAYERGVADGSIVPLEEEEEDIFGETESGIDPEPEPPVQPVNQPNQQAGRPQQYANQRR